MTSNAPSALLSLRKPRSASGASGPGPPCCSACRFAPNRGAGSSVHLINSLGEDKTILWWRSAKHGSTLPASDLYAVGTSAIVHKVVKIQPEPLLFPRAWNAFVGEFTQFSLSCEPRDPVPEGRRRH